MGHTLTTIKRETLEDSLTRKATAFGSYAELTASLANGYVPTLSRRQAAQAALGRAVEQAGHRVYWVA
jgi:hypothetical protein